MLGDVAHAHRFMPRCLLRGEIVCLSTSTQFDMNQQYPHSIFDGSLQNVESRKIAPLLDSGFHVSGEFIRVCHSTSHAHPTLAAPFHPSKSGSGWFLNLLKRVVVDARVLTLLIMYDR